MLYDLPFPDRFAAAPRDGFVIDASGYTGWIGCEYRPSRGSQPGGTSAGLGRRKRS